MVAPQQPQPCQHAERQMPSNFFYPSILGPGRLLAEPKVSVPITEDKLAALQQKLAADAHLVTAVTVLRAKYAEDNNTAVGYASGSRKTAKH